MTAAGVIDANVLLRYIVEEPPAQAEAVDRMLDRITHGAFQAVLFPTVFLEVVFVLERSYQASREDISDALHEILSMDGFMITNRTQLVDATIEYRRRSNISFADAYHCAMARDFHDGVIVSFDRKLGNVPGIQRREPDEI